MRKIIAFLLMLIVASCSSPVTKPQNLISEKDMSGIIADLALNDQMGMLNQTGNLETNTIFIFKKYHITSKQFSDSYKYYLAKPSILEEIYNDAQDIIKDKDPDADKYIEKNKLKKP